MDWEIRPFAAAADRAWVRLLWQAAMPPSWPVLPAGIGQLAQGLVAEAGVPRDLPAAVHFFASRGWRHTHDTLDLVTDLAAYRPPPGTTGRAARSGITITRATGDDLEAVCAFEAAAFPSWARWFGAARPEHVLLARTRSGAIAGTLPGRGPRLPHRLDHTRVVLPPRRIPALAALCHVLQPSLTRGRL